MSIAKYAFNARYIGRQAVRGPFSDSGLSEVVSELRSKSMTQPLHSSSGLKSSHDELRCNLEFCDKSLLVTITFKTKSIPTTTVKQKYGKLIKIALQMIFVT